jgi:hypothetical protein
MVISFLEKKFKKEIEQNIERTVIKGASAALRERCSANNHRNPHTGFEQQ